MRVAEYAIHPTNGIDKCRDCDNLDSTKREGDEMSRVALGEVTVGSEKYTVSTINRNSSCTYGDLYAETMIFHNGNIIFQDEAAESSVLGHKRALAFLEKMNSEIGHEAQP